MKLPLLNGDHLPESCSDGLLFLGRKLFCRQFALSPALKLLLAKRLVWQLVDALNNAPTYLGECRT